MKEHGRLTTFGSTVPPRRICERSCGRAAVCGSAGSRASTDRDRRLEPAQRLRRRERPRFPRPVANAFRCDAQPAAGLGAPFELCADACAARAATPAKEIDRAERGQAQRKNDGDEDAVQEIERAGRDGGCSLGAPAAERAASSGTCPAAVERAGSASPTERAAGPGGCPAAVERASRAPATERAADTGARRAATAEAGRNRQPRPHCCPADAVNRRGRECPAAAAARAKCGRRCSAASADSSSRSAGARSASCRRASGSCSRRGTATARCCCTRAGSGLSTGRCSHAARACSDAGAASGCAAADREPSFRRQRRLARADTLWGERHGPAGSGEGVAGIGRQCLEG